MESPQTPVPGMDRNNAPQETGDVLAEGMRRQRVAAYIGLLKSDSLDTRWKVAAALGEERDAAAVEPLIDALHDPYVDVAWTAAKSLGLIGDVRAVEPLIAVLASP